MSPALARFVFCASRRERQKIQSWPFCAVAAPLYERGRHHSKPHRHPASRCGNPGTPRSLVSGVSGRVTPGTRTKQAAAGQCSASGSHIANPAALPLKPGISVAMKLCQVGPPFEAVRIGGQTSSGWSVRQLSPYCVNFRSRPSPAAHEWRLSGRRF